MAPEPRASYPPRGRRTGWRHLLARDPVPSPFAHVRRPCIDVRPEPRAAGVAREDLQPGRAVVRPGRPAGVSGATERQLPGDAGVPALSMALGVGAGRAGTGSLVVAGLAADTDRGSNLEVGMASEAEANGEMLVGRGPNGVAATWKMSHGTKTPRVSPRPASSASAGPSASASSAGAATASSATSSPRNGTPCSRPRAAPA